MKEFLYWGQVQQRLSDHLEQTGSMYSFYDAARELWEEGASQRAEEFPVISFEEWDVRELDEFDRLYAQTPVDMSLFYQNFQQNRSADKASEAVITTDIIPLRVAWNQAVGLHHHGFFEIDYVMRGKARVELDGSSQKLCQGMFCFLSPNLVHDIVPEQGSQVISITIPGVTVEQTLYRLLRKESVLTDFFHSVLDDGSSSYMLITVPEERRVRELIRGLFHEHFAQEEYAGEVMPDHLAILFAFILRHCGDRYERHGGENSRKGKPAILPVLKYIQNNYRTVSLNEIARLFHYEPGYLGKLIKSATGKNYTDMIRELRIDEAKKLLRATTLSVDEVAEQAGYDSRVHFFRSFRAEVGITPGEYRKEKAKKNS